MFVLISTIDKLLPISSSARSMFSSLPKYGGDPLEEYIYDKLAKVVGSNHASEIAQAFKDAPNDTLELYNSILVQNKKFFSGKKGEDRRAKFTIGYAEILSAGAGCKQLQPWIDSFYWLEEQGLSTAEITAGFIELARFKPSEEELRLYNRIALAFLDNHLGRVPEVLKEATENIISILKQDQLSKETKEALLEGELHKTQEFIDADHREMLKGIGKFFLKYGAITAKVASALSFFL